MECFFQEIPQKVQQDLHIKGHVEVNFIFVTTAFDPRFRKNDKFYLQMTYRIRSQCWAFEGEIFK